MARFKLKPRIEESKLGKIIHQMAEDAADNGGKLPRASLGEYEKKIRKLIDDDDNLAIREICFVFDTPDKINFVIPDLGGKKYSNKKHANEIMGLVVIRGCGK